MLANKERLQEFEHAYVKARTIEQRILSDSDVLTLPELAEYHSLHAEWKMRIDSTRRIISYFTQRRFRRVLDLGCGNGWFTAKIAATGPSHVVGVDINRPELEQAERVFSKPNLEFRYHDILEDDLEGAKFEAVTINAAAQYFPDFTQLVERCFLHLAPGGELHILDTPFYLPRDVRQAEERTTKYFSSIGTPQMAEFYFHRTFNELNPYSYDFLYKPPQRFRRFQKKKSPFPWIRIS